MTAEFARPFRTLIGADHVIEDAAERAYYSSDISGAGDAVAALVVQPGSTEELAACVQHAASLGLALIARGGGMSYSHGYVPTRDHSIIIDMRRLDRIVEINEQ
jgi:D-lactate dehydrogenase (cytochrome)